jgi:hypothetical protein
MSRWSTTNLDLRGKKFGRLTGINSTESKNTAGAIIWKWKCDCGKISFHVGTRVFKGEIRSCGCLRKCKTPELSGLKSAYSDYKYAAKARNLEFELNFEIFTELVRKNCYYCGKLPKERTRKYKTRLNGVDRKDNNMGYTLNNCVSCCSECNICKNKMNYYQFLDHIKTIYNYMVGMGRL